MSNKKMSAKDGSAFGGKTKKEISKKAKVATKKKVAAKVRTAAAVKKVIKKTKTEPVPKRTSKKHKTMASSIMSHSVILTGSSVSKLKHKIQHNAKRITYMVLALTLGILSAGFVLGLLEMIYLKNNLRMGIVPGAHQFLGMQLFLLPFVYISIFFTGLCFGGWLGFWGWRAVYIERRHHMYRKN